MTRTPEQEKKRREAERIIAAGITALVGVVAVAVGMLNVPEGTTANGDQFLGLVLLGVAGATAASVVFNALHAIFPESVWEVVSKMMLAFAAVWTFAVTLARYVTVGEVPPV